MGMNPANQAAEASDWRRRLAKMRTIPGLRSIKPDHGALAPLDAEGLTAAAENPDHSEAGRAAAASALRERGFGVERWRLAVPGFIKSADLARGEALFFGWGRAIRAWSGRSIFAALVGILGLAVIENLTLDNYSHGQFPPGELPTLFRLLSGSQSAAYALGYVVLLASVIWLVSSALRRRPARIVLLRKFNERAFSAPLERAIAHELRPYGHVVTLSDKHIRDDAWGWLSTALLSLSNPLAAIWFVIGAPVRLVWRLFDRSRMGPATALDARDYRNLARRLRDHFGLNLQVAFAPKEALPVRTSDAWWRMVVRLLMDSSDAIVVDLSQVSVGTAWELDTIREDNVALRCVFVALWGRVEEAQAALQRWGFANPCHYYAPDGEMQRRSQFRAALFDAMRATHGVSA